VLRGVPPVAFLATTDPERAKGFYRDVLGLELRADEPYALVFDLAGTTLRIAKVERLEPQPHTVLGWTVADLDATLRELEIDVCRYEGLDQDEHGIWRSPGRARVAWFVDPDGNTLSLTELPRSPL
jgi:predicted enzyme related to lactoylglutathione lyase